jgi:hypothetical protein
MAGKDMNFPAQDLPFRNRRFGTKDVLELEANPTIQLYGT